MAAPKGQATRRLVVNLRAPSRKQDGLGVDREGGQALLRVAVRTLQDRGGAAEQARRLSLEELFHHVQVRWPFGGGLGGDRGGGEWMLRTLQAAPLHLQAQVEAHQGGALHALLADEFGAWAAAEVVELASHVALDTATFLQRVVALWEQYAHHLDLIRPATAPVACHAPALRA